MRGAGPGAWWPLQARRRDQADGSLGGGTVARQPDGTQGSIQLLTACAFRSTWRGPVRESRAPRAIRGIWASQPIHPPEAGDHLATRPPRGQCPGKARTGRLRCAEPATESGGAKPGPRPDVRVSGSANEALRIEHDLARHASRRAGLFLFLVGQAGLPGSLGHIPLVISHHAPQYWDSTPLEIVDGESRPRVFRAIWISTGLGCEQVNSTPKKTMAGR